MLILFIDPEDIIFQHWVPWKQVMMVFTMQIPLKLILGMAFGKKLKLWFLLQDSA
jgi:hypothetical protein